MRRPRTSGRRLPFPAAAPMPSAFPTRSLLECGFLENPIPATARTSRSPSPTCAAALTCCSSPCAISSAIHRCTNLSRHRNHDAHRPPPAGSGPVGHPPHDARMRALLLREGRRGPRRSLPPIASARVKSPLLPIFLIVVVDILGLTIMLPLLPFYAEKFGASPSVVGLLVSVYALCQLIAGPILGQISDRIGRKPVLTFSQMGTFVGFLVLAYAPSLAFVFVGRIIDGLTAGNLSIAQAYIADVTASKNRAKAFAVIGIAFGIGFLIGPGASGYLTSHYSFRVPILCAAGLSLLSILGTTFLLPAVPPLPEGELAANAQQELAAPVAPGGKRLKVFDWGTYLQYFRRPVLSGLLIEFFLFTLAFAT